MDHRLLRLAASLAVVLVFGGCFTFGLHETARTAPPGGFEGSVGMNPLVYFADEHGGEPAFWMFPVLAGRFGVAENFDLGVYWVFGPGLGMSAKWQLARGQVDAALQGRASFYGLFIGDAGAGFYTLNPRVIVSSEAPGAFPFCLNAGFDYWGLAAFGGGEVEGGGTLFLSGGVGLPVRLGQRRQVRFMPELSFMVPTATGTTFGEEGASFTIDPQGLIASLGFSLAVAGPYE